MKFYCLNGAYKNAGDFLIAQRCKELLRYCVPNCDIKDQKRNQSIQDKLDTVNQCDCFILAGGPAYDETIYPDTIPLCDNLADIKVPIIPIGLGWWGYSSSIKEIKAQKFSEKSQELMSRMASTGPLSCRDWESYHVLKENGYDAVMTGCAAWYDIAHIGQLNIRPECQKSDTICISDPAKTKHFELALKLTEFLHARYPSKKIKFIFHRGTGQADNYTDSQTAKCQAELMEQLKKRNIEIKDISFSSDGFHEYDNCFFHIGFRVHAHIYNLSIRQPSILIEEDSRGAGVNHALNLPGVKAYREFNAKRIGRVYRFYMQNCSQNRNAIQELALVLDEIELNRDFVYQQVFSRIDQTFLTMKKYICRILSAVK